MASQGGIALWYTYFPQHRPFVEYGKEARECGWQAFKGGLGFRGEFDIVFTEDT